MKTDIRAYLREHVLLFDGAMGTYAAERIPESVGVPCEMLNRTAPDKIEAIHRAYIEAGARAIQTNTFSLSRLTFGEAECLSLLREGFAVATRAAKDDAFVFCDIGPIAVTDADDLASEYRFIIDAFLASGGENFLFETGATADGLAEAARYIKSRKADAFVAVSFAAQPDGFTRAGQSVAHLIREAGAEAAIDAVGLNCTSGARHMLSLVAEMAAQSLPAGKILSAMPNAGYPTVRGNRTYYDGSPAYFAAQIAEIAAHGAKIVGGCCGTTPSHIAAAAKALSGRTVSAVPAIKAAPKAAEGESRFWDALCDPDARPFAVELDPPEGADMEKFIAGAKELSRGGASLITVADCPIGRARMDASLLACKLKRECGIDPLPHMTCRDRNLNATKALLLGLCAEGVHQVLAVTGDPIPSSERDEVRSVYNFHSRMLASYITSLGETVLPTKFRVFGALNINAHNFDVQLRLAREKEEAGVVGFLTQPILTEEALRNLYRAREVLRGKILGGIFPIVSHRNACFMNSEVAGVRVDPRIIDLYEGKSREQAEDLAVTVSKHVASAAHDAVDAFYLMTPFSRTALMCRIMGEITQGITQGRCPCTPQGAIAP